MGHFVTRSGPVSPRSLAHFRAECLFIHQALIGRFERQGPSGPIKGLKDSEFCANSTLGMDPANEFAARPAPP
jgi:hypothetical protein